MTTRIRVIDADALASFADLPALLAADSLPAIVCVASATSAERVLPFLRAHDELARHDEAPSVIAERARRLEARHADTVELLLRREHVDPVTGLLDRLRCLKWLGADDNAWPGGSIARGLLFLDLDMFEQFNEAYGRAAGDAILEGIAQALRAQARPGDLLYRLELEEFVVILERATREDVARDAEAMRRAVAAVGWPTDGGPVHVTASGGLAFLRPTGFRFAALQQANTAMYMAKILGRDNLVRHEDVHRLAAEAGATLELADLSEQAEVAKARLTEMAATLNQRLLAQARREAEVDALTGLRNRRHFDARLVRQMRSAERDGRPLALALCDIDDFGAFNKAHGHPTGDAVLRAFAEVAQRSVRGSDWMARYGGEEFCLVMEAGAAEAERVAERIRAAASDLRVASFDGLPLGMTVSVGVVCYDPRRDTTAERLVQRASLAALAAKAAGKNCVVRR